MSRAVRLSALLSLLLLAPPAVGQTPPPAPAQDDPETAALLAEERRDADLERRRGKVDSAKGRFEELLEERASDGASRLGLALCLRDLAQTARAEEEAARALGDLATGPPE